VGEDRITIGETPMPCTGTRTHVKSSGEIENFRLIKDFKYDPIAKEYLLIGLIGRKTIVGFEDMVDVSRLDK
jgi:hypothetical protein